MKSVLHLIIVIVMASILNDFHQLAMRSSWSDDCSLSHKHGNMVGDNSVGVLMTGVSATPKRPKRSKIIFQIKIGTSDPKKKKARKGKVMEKKLVRGNRRKLSSHRREKHLGKRRNHRNHYHFLRKQYNKKLQALFKHGNHYHRPKPRTGLFKKWCCGRNFARKDMTFNKRSHGKQSRRPSKKRRPFLRNSRRSKQFRRQSRRGKKTPFRKNQRREPAKSNRYSSRRSKKVLPKYPSRKKGSKISKGRLPKRINRRKIADKGKAVEFFVLYETRKKKKSRRTKPSLEDY